MPHFENKIVAIFCKNLMHEMGNNLFPEYSANQVLFDIGAISKDTFTMNIDVL